MTEGERRHSEWMERAAMSCTIAALLYTHGKLEEAHKMLKDIELCDGMARHWAEMIAKEKKA